MLLAEFPLGSKICEKLTAGDILHQEVEVAGVLCETLKTNLYGTKEEDFNYNSSGTSMPCHPSFNLAGCVTY